MTPTPCGSPRAALRAAIAALVVGCGPSAQYVHPPAPPHGAAPGVKVQRISDDGAERHYVLVFAPGDDVLGGLTELAEQEHLGAAQISAIGGVRDAALGFFDKERRLFRENRVGQAEVTSLLGDIALLGDKPVVHVHVNVALPDGTTRGGHLLGAHVWPTLEVFVVESPRALHKQHDEGMGLDLIEPDGKR